MPFTRFIADSSVVALKSGIFVSAISVTCAKVTLPTLFLFGTPEPFSIPAAFISKVAAGGVFVINVNDLSENTVITTGIVVAQMTGGTSAIVPSVGMVRSAIVSGRHGVVGDDHGSCLVLVVR